MPLKVVLKDPLTVSRFPPLSTVPPTVIGPEVALQVCPALSMIGLLRVWLLALLQTIPPARIIRELPARVKAPAVALNVRELISQGASTFGASCPVPASTMAAVPSLAGAIPPAQFAAVLQLLSTPPPVQVNVAALDSEKDSAT